MTTLSESEIEAEAKRRVERSASYSKARPEQIRIAVAVEKAYIRNGQVPMRWISNGPAPVVIEGSTPAPSSAAPKPYDPVAARIKAEIKAALERDYSGDITDSDLPARNYVEPHVLEKLRADIDADRGHERELLWSATINSAGKVASATLCAWGNEDCVSIPNSVLGTVNTPTDADMIIHVHPSGWLDPSDEDHRMGEYYSRFSIGLCTVDPRVERIRFVSKPPVSEATKRYNEWLSTVPH